MTDDLSLRLVELDKLRLATRKEEAKELASKGGVDPYIVLLPPSASKGGVSEKLVRVCEECKEEFCSGTCIIFQYDSYQVQLTALGSVTIFPFRDSSRTRATRRGKIPSRQRRRKNDRPKVQRRKNKKKTNGGFFDFVKI